VKRWKRNECGRDRNSMAKRGKHEKTKIDDDSAIRRI